MSFKDQINKLGGTVTAVKYDLVKMANDNLDYRNVVEFVIHTTDNGIQHMQVYGNTALEAEQKAVQLCQQAVASLTNLQGYVKSVLVTAKEVETAVDAVEKVVK